MVKSLLDAEEAPLALNQGLGQRGRAALQGSISFEDARKKKKKRTKKKLSKHNIFDLSKRLISCSDTCV